MSSSEGAETVEPLASLASKALLDRIKEAANGLEATFACGGSVKCSRPIQVLFWEDGATPQSQAKKIELPRQAADAAALKNLFATCSPATFGNMREGADTLNTSYRKALKLDTQRFAVSLDVAELGILSQIKTLMAPDAVDIIPQLYMLNIHQEGDFFKAHVDTPRSEAMLGSLVIALPSIHEGGELTIQHKERSHVFDWSLSELPTEPIVQWGAFYSDCKHEVHKIKSGARITVTYNLMAVKAASPPLKAISPSSLALRRVIEEAVTTPGFLEEGGTLAFGCQHAYPHNSKAFLSLGLEAQLKGADACLVAVAHDLGLPVCIKPLYKKHSSHYYSPDPDEHIAAQRKGYVGSHFGLSINERDPEDVCGASSEEEYDYQFVFDKSDRRRNLIWCHDVSHQEVAEVFMTYGNEYHLGHIYSHAIILIDIPSSAHRLCA